MGILCSSRGSSGPGIELVRTVCEPREIPRIAGGLLHFDLVKLLFEERWGTQVKNPPANSETQETVFNPCAEKTS